MCPLWQAYINGVPLLQRGRLEARSNISWPGCSNALAHAALASLFRWFTLCRAAVWCRSCCPTLQSQSISTTADNDLLHVHHSGNPTIACNQTSIHTDMCVLYHNICKPMHMQECMFTFIHACARAHLLVVIHSIDKVPPVLCQ